MHVYRAFALPFPGFPGRSISGRSSLKPMFLSIFSDLGAFWPPFLNGFLAANWPLEVQPLILFLLVQKEELRYLEKYHERKEPLQVVWGLDGESDFT
jgi:hypothetical protein